MKQNIVGIAFFSILIFMLSGCVQNEFGLPDRGSSSNSGYNNQNPWGAETDEGENIDISDLDENITESELGMSEEMNVRKIKRIAFPTAEYSRYAGTGKGTIKGTIFIKNAYGEKIVGSDTRLYLNPVTSYSNQWYAESYIGGKKMEKADSRLFNYLKFTASDKNGVFAFYGVPSGSYYLIGTVKCGSQCGFDTDKNIRIATRVSVSGNSVVEQDLSRNVD